MRSTEEALVPLLALAVLAVPVIGVVRAGRQLRAGTPVRRALAAGVCYALLLPVLTACGLATVVALESLLRRALLPELLGRAAALLVVGGLLWGVAVLLLLALVARWLGRPAQRAAPAEPAG